MCFSSKIEHKTVTAYANIESNAGYANWSTSREIRQALHVTPNSEMLYSKHKAFIYNTWVHFICY